MIGAARKLLNQMNIMGSLLVNCLWMWKGGSI